MRNRIERSATCLAVATSFLVVGCSSDGGSGAPTRASAAATTLPNASAPSHDAWPRGLVCGVEAREVTSLGDPVQWRTIAFTRGVESLSEWSRDVTRSGAELQAAGFAPAASGVAGAFTRADPGRDLTATLYPKGRAKLLTHCNSDAEHTTLTAERAGWITAYVHRRIGRATLVSITTNDGDERYVRAQLSHVEARPDTSGLVDAGGGAFRSAPGAEPEALIILTDEPLLVEFRTGNATLVESSLEMHKATRGGSPR